MILRFWKNRKSLCETLRKFSETLRYNRVKKHTEYAKGKNRKSLCETLRKLSEPWRYNHVAKKHKEYAKGKNRKSLCDMKINF